MANAIKEWELRRALAYLSVMPSEHEHRAREAARVLMRVWNELHPAQPISLNTEVQHEAVAIGTGPRAGVFRPACNGGLAANDPDSGG